MSKQMNERNNDQKDRDERRDKSSSSSHNSRGRSRRGKSRNRRSGAEKPERMDTSRSNNPAWYYLDEKIADQTSQMSFQHLAGYPIVYDGFKFDVPNIVRIHMNPSPGVQLSEQYGSPLSQHSGMNLAAFRLYSKLSAFTGRVQSYAPQDVATMMLAMGEVISMTEWIRRAFGIAYTMNMRNRDYPRNVLEFGMQIDSTDLFTNLADYRTRFNTIITLINQLPIPKNVAYFDKCARLYEKLYLDSPSSMAQTLVTGPATTWELDEQSYSGGTVLRTAPWMMTKDGSLQGRQPMSTYLSQLEKMVGLLLNSTSLSVVYTDILNYASKLTMEFWRMDYLFEDYQILPEYDVNFLLQMHNATVCSLPVVFTDLKTAPYIVTPYNDVYPDVNRNCIFYNPGFYTLGGVDRGMPRTGKDVLIDMLSDQVTLTDRIEVTRYASICNGRSVAPSESGPVNAIIDTALPDHYITNVYFETQTQNLTAKAVDSTLVPHGNFEDISSLVSNIDWAPRFWEVNASGTDYTGRYTSDVNFYTVVDGNYLRRLHDFVGLALYDIR